MFNGRNYNGSQLLRACSFSQFNGANYNNRDRVALSILSEVAITKKANELPDKIANIVENYSRVSVGMALEKLIEVSQIPDEFDGGLDGIDALAYHLDGHTCSKVIEVMNKVLKRFDEIEIK